MLQELKETIDSMVIHSMASRHGQQLVAEMLSIGNIKVLPEINVYELFKEETMKLIAPDNGVPCISFEEIKGIEDALVCESVLVGCDNKVYIDIVDILRTVNSTWIPFKQKDAWNRIVGLVKAYLVFKPESHIEHYSLRQHRPKAFDIGIAARRLKEAGYHVYMDGTKLNYTEFENQLVADLERKISDVGGYTLLNYLVYLLVQNGYYIEEFQCYAVSSRLSFLQSDSKPMLPFGYLFNLAVKHANGNSSLSPRHELKKVKEIGQLATDYVTLFGVQPYGIWEVQFRHNKPVGAYLQEIAIFDSIYTLPSCDPYQVLDIVEGLFKWLDQDKMVTCAGFTLSEFIVVCRKIIELSKKHGPSNIYLSRIKKELPSVNEKALQSILRALSFPAMDVNSDFALPVEINKQNSLFRPLIAHSATKYSLPDITWVSLSFYESIAAVSRTVETRTNIADIIIGNKLEVYIKKKMLTTGLSFASGKYMKGTAFEGECDLLVETSKTILIIEVKKKALTRLSKGGKDTEILVDLSESLLDAQIQGGKVELLLLKHGYIELEDDAGGIKQILHQGRSIERIAVALHDFGAFQDRTFITSYLEQLVDSTITVDTEPISAMAKRCKKINEQVRLWTIQAMELKTHKKAFEHFPYYDCWFLSIPQLLTLLRYATDNESFCDALKSIKGVSLCSSNFYFEFLHCFVKQKQLNKEKQVH